MKRTTKLSATLTAVIMLTANPTPADAADGATTGWEYGTIDLVYPGFEVPCLDETLLVIYELPYMMHEVWSPNGGYHSRFKYVPGTPSQGGRILLIGETSGRVYHSQNGTTFNAIFHLGPGEIYRDRSNERYLSEDGTRLTINWHTWFTVNANGELIADLELLDCRLH